MATPNYAFEKRQKELAKKAKKEEKKQAKLRGDVVSDADEAEVLETAIEVAGPTEMPAQSS
jgi:hypothetical protein